MEKQKIALAAIGITGILLMGTALVSVAYGGNNSYRVSGTGQTTETLTANLAATETLEYMTPSSMPTDKYLNSGMPPGWEGTNPPGMMDNESGDTNQSHGGRGPFHGRRNDYQPGCPMDAPFARNNNLNTTQIEGVLEYNDGTYLVDTTTLYLGNEWFLDSLAQSDYDRDGTYEYITQELDGLLDTTVVLNGVLADASLYVTHINGIWLRMPTQDDITEVEGTLEYNNETYRYSISGTELLIEGRGFSQSDIDGNGALESTIEELNGLVGTIITADGILVNGALHASHINGIWIR